MPPRGRYSSELDAAHEEPGLRAERPAEAVVAAGHDCAPGERGFLHDPDAPEPDAGDDVVEAVLQEFWRAGGPEGPAFEIGGGVGEVGEYFEAEGTVGRRGPEPDEHV